MNVVGHDAERKQVVAAAVHGDPLGPGTERAPGGQHDRGRGDRRGRRQRRAAEPGSSAGIAAGVPLLPDPPGDLRAE